MEYATIKINTEAPNQSGGSVLVIYTGGTLGMVFESRKGQLVPFDFEQLIDKVPEICRLNQEITFLSLKEPIDSSNITPEVWIELANIIDSQYAHYDSFVVLHGTDTMAYTASALSFLLEGLQKPVILTGAQLPIGVARSDARENILTALEIASARNSSGGPMITEVCVYFNSFLLRGNRSKKQESSDFDAFHSENYPYLAKAGVSIDYNLPFMMPVNPGARLSVQQHLDPNVAFLKLFPGITPPVVKSLCHIPGLRGIVLETFGAGNATTEDWFLHELEAAMNRGIVVFNVSQCDGGRVSLGRYQTSRRMQEMGVISGEDITAEAAITKMMYVFGKSGKVDTTHLLSHSLRGEMSPPLEI
ncbi:L-asparaginase [Dyadobacter jejuensis]|uniref:asparaginase n=1 Tax=Dyadobacter jejuensis TaxID=1082580 RepID=A0A316A8J7_9BACT|nr:asparaginase [Dyadobacter jejuensis]PWJ54246.1 L-asparaginase [Dyadobacter jejuensis]